MQEVLVKLNMCLPCQKIINHQINIKKPQNKGSNNIKKQFDNETVYNEKDLRTKTKLYYGKINTIFHNERMPKEGFHCIFFISNIDWFCNEYG